MIAPGPPPIALSPLDAAQANLLAALHGEAFAAPWSAASFAELLLSHWRGGHLAREGDRALGFILVQRIADEAEILTLAVVPTARRRGIARTLVAAALDEARRAGLRRMLLEVAVANHAARALYERLGFVRVGERKAYYAATATGGDALVLARDLVVGQRPQG